MLWLKKNANSGMSEKVGKEVFCVWKSHHLLPVPVLDSSPFLLYFGEFICYILFQMYQQYHGQKYHQWKSNNTKKPQQKKGD